VSLVICSPRSPNKLCLFDHFIVVILVSLVIYCLGLEALSAFLDHFIDIILKSLVCCSLCILISCTVWSLINIFLVSIIIQSVRSYHTLLAIQDSVSSVFVIAMSSPTPISTESYTFVSRNNFQLRINVSSLALGYVTCISSLFYCHAQIIWSYGYVVTFSPHMWLYSHGVVSVIDSWSRIWIVVSQKRILV
jgi:hypothetical protein